MPRAFDVTPSTPSAEVSQRGTGELAFTVSNALGRAVRAKLTPVPKGATHAAWLTVDGGAERELPADGTAQVVVRLLVPAGTRPDRYELALLASSVNNPDEEFAESPVVSFVVPALPPPPPPFRWWPIALAAAAVLLLGAGYGVYRFANRGCSADSCEDGCCAQGACVSPTTAAQCGKGGAACVACEATLADRCADGSCRCGGGPACGAGQKCESGKCVCDPATCAGCCEGGACKLNAFPQCGVNGEACKACDATRTDRCLNGGCGCGPLGGECAAGQRCNGGQCVCEGLTCPDGCCADGRCVPSTFAQCGARGVVCVACNPALANGCVSGDCRCGAGPACGPNQRCQGGACLPLCQLRTVELRPPPYDFRPAHRRGDREYNGHGPKVTFSLSLGHNGTTVSFTVRMRAEETVSDWTTVDETRTEALYNAESGWQVSRILSAPSVSHGYTDTNHSVDVFSPGGPVQRLEYVGDTDGDEAGSRTGVRVFYNPVRLELRQISNCAQP